jgi:pilus assembly protein Flp/PilA
MLTGTGAEKMMSCFIHQIVDFLKREDGPAAVEYAVMLSLIMVVCIVSITTLGSNANKTFSKVANAMATSGS